MKNLRTLAIGKFGLGFGKVRWSSISNYAQIIRQKKYQRSNMLKYLRTKTFSDSSGNFLSAVDLFVFASAQNNHEMRELMSQTMTIDRRLCCFCKHLNPILSSVALTNKMFDEILPQFLYTTHWILNKNFLSQENSLSIFNLLETKKYYAVLVWWAAIRHLRSSVITFKEGESFFFYATNLHSAVTLAK